VLGLGSSGDAAARLLLDHGIRVTVLDAAAGAAQDARAAALRAAGAAVRLGAGPLPGDAFDLCVVSPGLRADDRWVAAARERGVRVWGELELGWRACRSRVLAVTGSNGKSTLVKLCRDALELAGFRADMAGNYGPPLCAAARSAEPPDWLVVEVSSFQLETVEAFRPEAGILLNLNPNHLDRHGTLEIYSRLKARLFSAMGPEQAAIVPFEAPAVIREALPGACRKRTFGVGGEADAAYGDGVVRVRGAGEYDLQGTPFGNAVMGLTAAAAMAAAHACGLDPACVAQAARAFQRLPHRMEPVAAIRGVRFIDDSKATNLAALEAGLEMAGGPVRLIAGGMLKEHDLSATKKRLVNRVRGVYIIGKSAQEMASAWQDAVPCSICRDLNEAVHGAWKEAHTGEVVLLSPGCASFDQFLSFEDRGEQFKAIVRGLKEE
jgi:UDP-N-acetylmuramoylalanine--D-glutamate ligase